MMDRGRFDLLVDRIEQRFAGRSEALTSHTWRWLIMGYAVVICLTLLLVGTGLAIFVAGVFSSGPAVLLIVPGGALVTFGLGQAGALLLAAPFEPRGRLLSDSEAPELHRLIHLLCEQIETPLPDRILITEDFNAAIVQHPRLGIFGWSSSTVILGLPLLLAASVPEVASVLAHECAHLSLKHGRHGNRIYNMHQTWEKLFHQLQQKSHSGLMRLAGSLVRRFLNWYWPRFHARAFVLSRHNEYLADLRAVKATSVEHAASALWRIECTSLFLEQHFWKTLWEETAVSAEPPTDLCARLRAAFLQAPRLPDANRWCTNALQRVSGHEDTHPALRDRLLAIGRDPDQLRNQGFPEAPEICAASGLLGPSRAMVEDSVNEQWIRSVRVIWADRHRRAASLRQLATDGDPDVARNTVSVPRLWNQTREILDARGLDAAEPQLRRLLAMDPEHAGALFAFGQLRLNQGHADGEQLLKQVVDLQTTDWTQAAGTVLERHLSTQGRPTEVRELRQQLDRFEKDRADAEKERSEIRRRDTFLHHGLSDSELQQVISDLHQHDHCRRAWLVQKELKYFPEERLFVLCADRGPEAGSQRALENDRLISSLILSVEVPGRLFVVTPTGEFRDIARRLMKRPDALIMER